MTSKPDIRDLSLDELTQHMASIGEKPYRAAQIFEWIYQKGAWSFDAMKNLPGGITGPAEEQFQFKSEYHYPKGCFQGQNDQIPSRFVRSRKGRMRVDPHRDKNNGVHFNPGWMQIRPGSAPAVSVAGQGI